METILLILTESVAGAFCGYLLANAIRKWIR